MYHNSKCPNDPYSKKQKSKLVRLFSFEITAFGISSDGALSSGLLNVFDASYYCALHLCPVDAFVQRFVDQANRADIVASDEI